MGDGVEEARGRHPARFTRVLGDHTGERLALLRGCAGQRVVEDPCISARQVLAGQQRVDIRERTAVEGGAGDVVGGEAAGDGADGRQQAGERPAVALRRDPGGAVRLEAREADRAAHAVRHAAPVAVVVERSDPVVVLFVDLDVGVIAGQGGALVGGAAAGLGDQRPRDRGAPERLAGPGHDGAALGQRFLRKRFPDRVGEVAAEMGEAHHGMLRAVHAARQRRHQGDGRDDADDRPGAETEAPLPRGVDRAGGGVPDQQEARQHQHAGVEGEKHVADGRRPVRPQSAEEGEDVAGRAVAVGEEAAVDGLPERLLGRWDRGQGKPCKSQDKQEHREAGTAPGVLVPRARTRSTRCSRSYGAPLLAAALHDFPVPGTVLPISEPRPQCPFQSPEQCRSRPHGLRQRAAEIGGEQEAECAHGLSSRPPRGWRGRAGGASLRRRARARPRRWRRGARRCGSAASRASARPPA